MLRALLRTFYCHLTGECFPSYDAIAAAAGCARSTIAEKLRILERLGIVETIRRKVVASFVSRAQRIRFDVAVQISNSYRFNLPIDAGQRTATWRCRYCAQWEQPGKTRRKPPSMKPSPNFRLKPA